MPGAGARHAQQEFQQMKRIMQYAEKNYVQYQWHEPDYANDTEALRHQDPFGMAVVQQPLPETSLMPESTTSSVPTAAPPTVMPGADDTRVLRQQIYGTDHVPSLASCPPRIRSILTSAKYSNQLEEHHIVELKKFLLQQCNQGNPIPAITAIRRFMPQTLQQKVFDPVTKDMCDKAARKSGILRSEDQVPDDIGIDTSCAGNQGRVQQPSVQEDFTSDDFFSTPPLAAPIKMSIDDATKSVYQTSTNSHTNDDKHDEIIEDDGPADEPVSYRPLFAAPLNRGHLRQVNKAVDELVYEARDREDEDDTVELMFIMVPLEIRNILRKAYYEPERTIAREMDMLREYIYTNIRERLEPSDAQLFLKECKRILSPENYNRLATDKLLIDVGASTCVEDDIDEPKKGAEEEEAELIRIYNDPRQLEGVINDDDGTVTATQATVQFLRRVVLRSYRRGTPEYGDDLVAKVRIWFGDLVCQRAFNVHIRELCRRNYRRWMRDQEIEPGEDETGISDEDFERISTLVTQVKKQDIPGMDLESLDSEEEKEPGPEAVAWLRWLIVATMKCRLDSGALMQRLSEMFSQQFLRKLFENKNFKADMRETMLNNAQAPPVWLNKLRGYNDHEITAGLPSYDQSLYDEIALLSKGLNGQPMPKRPKMTYALRAIMMGPGYQKPSEQQVDAVEVLGRLGEIEDMMAHEDPAGLFAPGGMFGHPGDRMIRPRMNMPYRPRFRHGPPGGPMRPPMYRGPAFRPGWRPPVPPPGWRGPPPMRGGFRPGGRPPRGPWHPPTSMNMPPQ